MHESNATLLETSLLETARLGSGLGAVYCALDLVVDGYGLDDAALVVEVPGLGRQVLHARRRPLGDDDGGLHEAPEGLHAQPRLDETREHRLVEELLLALAAFALRYDARPDPGPGPHPGGQGGGTA